MEGKKKINKKAPTNHILGENLRLFRKKADLNLIQLARKLNISPQQLQKYETGENRISAERLFEISKILNISLGNFYVDSSGAYKKNNRNKNRSDILLENFSRINSEKIKKYILDSTNIFVELGV